MAWSFYSERGTQAINVDILKAVRLIEALSGERLVHLKAGRWLSTEEEGKPSGLKQLNRAIAVLECQNQDLEEKIQNREKKMHTIHITLQALEEQFR